jgi:hypothetical protein
LVVWHYGKIPNKTVKDKANDLWSFVEEKISPVLKKQCFVLLWVSATAKQPLKLKPFTTLKPPEKFDINEPSQWLERQLLQHKDYEKINQKHIDYCLSVLKSSQNDLAYIYDAMEKISHYLQGDVQK